MALPSAVKKAGDESDRLAQQHYGTAAGTQDPAPTPNNQQTEPPGGTGSGLERPSQTLQDDENTPEYWKRRFTGMKSRYDQEVTELRQQVQQVPQLQAQLVQMQNTIAQLQANSQPQPQASKAGFSKDEILAEALTDEEREQYTPEHIDMMVRLGQTIASRLVSQHTGQVTERLQKVEQHSAKTAADRFWERVDAAVPDWEQIQATPAFQSWILGFDPYLGAVRNDKLVEAQNAYDADRVIGFFNAYLDNKGPQPSQQQQTDPRERLVEPGNAGGSDAPTPQGQTFTETYVADFYSDVSKGKYRNNPEEGKRIEKAIEAAARAGRILPG